MARPKSKKRQDLDFLLERAMEAGCTRLIGVRDCGESSNSIVAIAYGLIPLSKQEMPYDRDDKNACEQMWQKLPEHRKTKDAKAAMKRAVIKGH